MTKLRKFMDVVYNCIMSDVVVFGLLYGAIVITCICVLVIMTLYTFGINFH